MATFNPTAWIDGRLEVLGKSLAAGVVDEVANRIDSAESNILSALTASSNNVISTLGTTVQDTVGKVTVDTATLAQSIVNSIKALLPFPFRSTRGQSAT